MIIKLRRKSGNIIDKEKAAEEMTKIRKLITINETNRISWHHIGWRSEKEVIKFGHKTQLEKYSNIEQDAQLSSGIIFARTVLVSS